MNPCDCESFALAFSCNVTPGRNIATCRITLTMAGAWPLRKFTCTLELCPMRSRDMPTCYTIQSFIAPLCGTTWSANNLDRRSFKHNVAAYASPTRLRRKQTSACTSVQSLHGSCVLVREVCVRARAATQMFAPSSEREMRLPMLYTLCGGSLIRHCGYLFRVASRCILSSPPSADTPLPTPPPYEQRNKGLTGISAHSGTTGPLFPTLKVLLTQ